MDTAVTRVEVDGETAGTLVVRWDLEGPPVAVDVAVGITPEHVDHAHQVTVQPGTSEITLTGSWPSRTFVSVAPHGGGPAVVAADRRILLGAVTNFRDLGGYAVAGGGRTRWGLVFRADALHGLTPSDLATYERLGIAMAFDLRGDAEREREPDAVAARSFSLLSTTPADPPVAPPPVRSGEEVLRDLYIGLIDNAAAMVGELIGSLAGEGGTPAVFHCHAGKDRTGVVAAVLLEALGVDRDAILDDYELTARYRTRMQHAPSFERMVAGGMAPEAAAGVLTTPRWAMQEALEHLDATYGDIDAYLTGPAGMGAEVLDALRRHLVARPGEVTAAGS